MCPHQVSTSVSASTASVRPCSGSSKVATRTVIPSERRCSAIGACRPLGYTLRTSSCDFSCLYSFHIVTLSVIVFLSFFWHSIFCRARPNRIPQFCHSQCSFRRRRVGDATTAHSQKLFPYPQ